MESLGFNALPAYAKASAGKRSSNMETEALPGIVKFPDPALKQKVRQVAKITDEVRDLVKVMRKVMHRHQGIGLAANQIGLPLAIFVAQHKGEFFAFINPKIVKASREKAAMSDGKQEYLEGCLSIPGQWGVVARHSAVTVEGLSPGGRRQRVPATGVLAHIFQHEMDHLDGRVFTERTKKVFALDKKIP